MSSKTIKIPFGGKHYPEIKRYLDEGYMIVREQVFPAKRVIMCKENKKGDMFCIKTFEDAAHFLSGGFPRPDMVMVDTIECPTLGDKEKDGANMWQKMKLGWKIKSYDTKTGFIISREEDIQPLVSNAEELKELTDYRGE